MADDDNPQWFVVVFLLAQVYLYEKLHPLRWPPLSQLRVWITSRVDIGRANHMVCSLPSTITGGTKRNKLSLFCRRRAGGALFDIFTAGGVVLVRPTAAGAEIAMSYLSGGIISRRALERFLATSPREQVLRVVTGTQELHRREILAGIEALGQLVLPESSLRALLETMSNDMTLERVGASTSTSRYTRYRRPTLNPSALNSLPNDSFLRPVVITHGERDRNPICMICHADFELMEEVHALPCFWAHGCSPVHMLCIQPWLTSQPPGEATCPKCFREVREG